MARKTPLLEAVITDFNLNEVFFFSNEAFPKILFDILSDV